MPSAAIVIQSCWPENMLSGEVRAEKAVNSDHVVLSSDARVAHYICQGNTELRTDFKGKIFSSRGWLSRGVGYAEIGYSGFYCIVFVNLLQQLNSGLLYVAQQLMERC